jgi:hypothetical protein
MASTTRLRHFAKNLLVILLFIVSIAAAIYDVFWLAFLMFASLDLPYDIALLLALGVFILYLAVVELVVWVVCRVASATTSVWDKRKVKPVMSRSQLSDLLNDMSNLQVDSLEARQTLIHESFRAAQNNEKVVEVEAEVTSPEQE